MRIRNRQPPPPFDYFPTSDPLFNHRSTVVQLSPSDHRVIPTNGPDCSDQQINKEKNHLVFLDEDEVKLKKNEDHDDNNNDTRKEMNNNLLSANIDSPQALMKKRRTNMEMEMLLLSDNDHKKIAQSMNNTKKKKGRGGALMEGSRCSRVNGRGWRCCQQTLVGYSLCEHHLGKGRLRSMNMTSSVRNIRESTTSNNNFSNMEYRPLAPLFGGDRKNEEEEEDDDEKKPPLMKKRMKIGMVKARSINSLLGQTSPGN